MAENFKPTLETGDPSCSHCPATGNSWGSVFFHPRPHAHPASRSHTHKLIAGQQILFLVEDLTSQIVCELVHPMAFSTHMADSILKTSLKRRES